MTMLIKQIKKIKKQDANQYEALPYSTGVEFENLKANDIALQGIK